MADSALRARVERLLDGDFRADDLTRLFLSVRSNCNGRESVQEVGDFVAHREERTKGIVTRTVREWFEIVQFFAPRFREGGPYPIDWNSLPSNTREYLTVAMRRTTNPDLKKEAGLTRARAQRIFPRLLEKIEENPDGTYRVNPTITTKETALINSLCTVLTAAPAFTLDKLFKDFRDTLKSHGLLRREEFANFENFKTPIGLYAVSVMQNCWVQTNDALSSKLFAYYEKPNSVINIIAPVPLPMEVSRSFADASEIQNVKNHGALGDGVADDTSAIQAAIDAIPGDSGQGTNVSGGGSSVSWTTAMFLMPVDASRFLHNDLTTMETWTCDLEVSDAMILIPLR